MAARKPFKGIKTWPVHCNKDQCSLLPGLKGNDVDGSPRVTSWVFRLPWGVLHLLDPTSTFTSFVWSSRSSLLNSGSLTLTWVLGLLILSLSWHEVLVSVLWLLDRGLSSEAVRDVFIILSSDSTMQQSIVTQKSPQLTAI